METMKEPEFVIVDTSKEFLTIYALCNEENTDAELTKAKAQYEEDAGRAKDYIKLYPEQAEYWEKRYSDYVKASFEAMPYTRFLVLQKEKVLGLPLKEISEEEYERAMDVLPPLNWGVSPDWKYRQFFMREFYYGTYTNQYAQDRETGKCYCGLVDITDENTWIHKRKTA